MDYQNYTLSSLRQDITDNGLNVKAIVQDILAFSGSLPDLETLNEAGRSKLGALRKCIEKLYDLAQDYGDPEILKEVDLHRQQFSRTLQAFRKANISTMLEIERANKEELFTMTGEFDIRQRGANRHNRTTLIANQDSIMERMLSISRHLSDTTHKSAATLETLASSSQVIKGTRDEIQNTAGTISQSGKLLKKYGRREWTDKILLSFAFIFFLACVFYIVQKRLF